MWSPSTTTNPLSYLRAPLLPSYPAAAAHSSSNRPWHPPPTTAPGSQSIYQMPHLSSWHLSNTAQASHLCSWHLPSPATPSRPPAHPPLYLSTLYATQTRHLRSSSDPPALVRPPQPPTGPPSNISLFTSGLETSGGSPVETTFPIISTDIPYLRYTCYLLHLLIVMY